MKVENPDCELFHSHKELLAKARLKDMQCLYCPPNRGDNTSGKGNDTRSWKRYRKTQYKPKEVEYEFG
jgi:hypothetical protein